MERKSSTCFPQRSPRRRPARGGPGYTIGSPQNDGVRPWVYMGYHGQTWGVNTFLNKKSFTQMFPLNATVPPHVVYSRTLSPSEQTTVLILFCLNRGHRGTRARPAETVGWRNRSVTKQLHFRISSGVASVQVQNLALRKFNRSALISFVNGRWQGCPVRQFR